MDNLWLLTEERPKQSVVLQIVEMYCKDFNDKITEHSEIKILPHIENGYFKFVYEIEGLSVAKANKIYIKTVSGNSSFLDFLLFKQEKAPVEGCSTDNLIMAIEETKTSDIRVFIKEVLNLFISLHIIKMLSCICYTTKN